MYQVKIFNGSLETTIHYPTNDEQSPHLLKAILKEKLSGLNSLSFSIPYNNVGFNSLTGLITKVKVIDTRDNSIRFTGRILPLSEVMSDNGAITKEVECEGALGYLNDTHTRRWNYKDKTPTEILTSLLSYHNSKVDNSRKINLGTIQFTNHITIDTNYETTLNAIITKLRNILGGDLKVRETNGLLYLDYLQAQGANNEVKIQLGYNMKDITREFNPYDVTTRIIPLGYGEGINQLDIKKVNNGVDYLEDQNAINTYGVIETAWTNKDIQNAYTLKIAGQTMLDQNKQPKVVLETNMLDLSVLAGHENEKYSLGDTLHLINSIFNLDVYARVIEQTTNLFEPWNPELVISTRKVSIIDEIIDLKQRNLNLENSPQGSTYIDTFGYAESIDSTHPFQMPIWLSPDILNVNRVRLSIIGQKYRAYEKGMLGGGAVEQSSGPSSATTTGASNTTSSGASSSSTTGASNTTSSGASSNQTTGASNTTSSGASSSTSSGPSSTDTTTMFTSYVNTHTETTTPYNDYGSYLDPNHTNELTDHVHRVPIIEHEHEMDHTHNISHTHNIDHTHNMPHTHGIDHNHNMPHTHGIDHTHNMPHTHTITIDPHEHDLIYGIFEDSYPNDVYVKINGQVVAGPFGSGYYPFSADIDLSAYIGTPNTTYNLEVTSSQNGRVNCWVSIQAFIQAK